MSAVNPESFAELFEQSLSARRLSIGEMITAEIIRIEHNVVILNSGLKSESFVPLEEFKDEDGVLEAKIGDFVTVTIEALEDGFGETRLSRDRAKKLAAWEGLERAMEEKRIVQGRITTRVKGGMGVMIDGIRAFLPGSLVDIRPVRDMGFLERSVSDFKVIKLDRRRNNVVLSRKAALEETTGHDREALLSSLKEGSIVKGVVKNLTDYGAFVDLGGIDGLLHITDITWRRVRHPSEVLTIGQEVEAILLKYDQERQRVSLGLKQLGDNPWVGASRRYAKGSRSLGKVTNLAEYGAFVEIEPGIEGLVHVSEMDWSNRNPQPGKVVQVGQEVEVMVLEIDEEKRRISLGMKQCQPNPWTEFAINNKPGTHVSGPVRSVTDFGVFVGLEGGIDALIHVSDLSWNDNNEELLRNYKRGDEVSAVVISVDTERERISLGIKQLTADGFTQFATSHPKGAVVQATVTAVEEKGARMNLAEGVEGYLRISEYARERTENLSAHMQVGDKLEVMVINIDRKTHQINLSIKALDAASEAEAIARHSAKSNPDAGRSSLGALLREHLDNRDSAQEENNK